MSADQVSVPGFLAGFGGIWPQCACGAAGLEQEPVPRGALPWHRRGSSSVIAPRCGHVNNVWWKDSPAEQSVEAEVVRRGFLPAGPVVVLKSRAFGRGDRWLQAFCIMRSPRDSLVAVPWDLQEASFSQSSGNMQSFLFFMTLSCGVCIHPTKTIFQLHCW